MSKHPLVTCPTPERHLPPPRRGLVRIVLAAALLAAPIGGACGPSRSEAVMELETQGDEQPPPKQEEPIEADEPEPDDDASM